jgi:hypothetical protein
MGVERKAAVAAACMVLFALPAHSGCKELAAAIDAAQKQMADDEVRLRDETTKRVRQANQLSAIHANLVLMDRAKCPMPADPVFADGQPYTAAAGRCAALGNDADTCRRELWRRSP